MSTSLAADRPANKTLQLAGATLIAGSLAFVGVFSYLAATFGYPDVLDLPADQVLPQLLRGGRSLRAVWFVYGALPLIFVFAGVASGSVLERSGRGLRTLGVASAVTAGIAMMVGLLRWPTIEWSLAQHWDAGDRGALAAVFDATNSFLGNVVGEFVGEMATAAWFLALGLAWRAQGRRVFGTLGVAAAGLMAVAALRNMTALVDPVAALNNVALPVWLIAIGVALVREGGTGARAMKLESVPQA